MLIFYAIVNGAGSVVNIVLEWFNDLSIEIPNPFNGDIEINLPNLPLIPVVDFPPWGVIPFRNLEDVRIFDESKILIIWIIELLGFSLPFGA